MDLPFANPKLQKVHMRATGRVGGRRKAAPAPKTPANAANKPPYKGPVVPMNGAGYASAPYAHLHNASRAGLRQSNKIIRGAPKLSEHGMGFLKCAFAPTDFNQTAVAGVPDGYDGVSLVKKSRFVAPITVGGSGTGTDFHYLLLPIPGFAYFYTTTPAGTPIQTTSTFVGVPYSDSATLFNSSGGGAKPNFTKFRMVSNHFELISTTNQMSWSGNIQSWKIPVQVCQELDDDPLPGPSPASNAMRLTVAGLVGTTSNIANQYSSSAAQGVYAGAYNIGSTFAFTQLSIGAYLNLPQEQSSPDFAMLGFAASSDNLAGVYYTGFDNNMESVYVRVSATSSATPTSFLLKTFSCVEYQTNTTSSLYEYQTGSPCDLLAISYYRSVIKQLPVAVSSFDNESFWKRVSDIMKQVSSYGALMPGTVGSVSSLTNQILQMLS